MEVQWCLSAPRLPEWAEQDGWEEASQTSLWHPLLCGRRPSSWLTPSARVLAGVVKGLASEKTHAQDQPEKSTSDSPQAHR